MIDREYVKLNTSIQTGSNSHELQTDEEGNVKAEIELLLPDNIYSIGNQAKKVDKVDMLTTKLRLSMENTPIAQIPLDEELSQNDTFISSCQMDVYPFSLTNDGQLKPQNLDQSSFPYYKHQQISYFLRLYDARDASRTNLINWPRYDCYANTPHYGFPEGSVFYPIMKKAGIIDTYEHHLMNLIIPKNHEKITDENGSVLIKSTGTLSQMFQDGLQNAMTYAACYSSIEIYVDLLYYEDESDIDPAWDPYPDTSNKVEVDIPGLFKYVCFDKMEVTTVANGASLLAAVKPEVDFNEQTFKIAYDTAPFKDTVPVVWNESYIDTYQAPQQLTLDVLKQNIATYPPPKRLYSYGVQMDELLRTYNFTIPETSNCGVMNIIGNEEMKNTFSFLPWIPYDISQYITPKYFANTTTTITEHKVQNIYNLLLKNVQSERYGLKMIYTSSEYDRLTMYRRTDPVTGEIKRYWDAEMFNFLQIQNITSTQSYIEPSKVNRFDTTTKLSSEPTFNSEHEETYTLSNSVPPQYTETIPISEIPEGSVFFAQGGVSVYFALGEKVTTPILTYNKTTGEIGEIDNVIYNSIKWFYPTLNPDWEIPNDVTIDGEAFDKIMWNGNHQSLQYLTLFITTEPLQKMQRIVTYFHPYTETITTTETGTTLTEVMQQIEHIPNLNTENNKFYILDGTTSDISIGDQEVIDVSASGYYKKTVYSQKEKYVASQEGTVVNPPEEITGVDKTTNPPTKTIYPLAVPTSGDYANTDIRLEFESTSTDSTHVIPFEQRSNEQWKAFTLGVQAVTDFNPATEYNCPDPVFVLAPDQPEDELISEEEGFDPSITPHTDYSEVIIGQPEYISRQCTNSRPAAASGNWFRYTSPAIGQSGIYKPARYESVYNISSQTSGTRLTPRANNSTGDFLKPPNHITWEPTTALNTRKYTYTWYPSGHSYTSTIAGTEVRVYDDILWSQNIPLYDYSASLQRIDQRTKTVYTTPVQYKGNVRLSFEWKNIPIVVLSPISSIVLQLTGMQLKQEIQPININPDQRGSSLVTTIPVVENYYSLASTLRDLHDEIVIVKESFDDQATYNLSIRSGQERSLRVTAKYITKDGNLHQLYIPKNGVFSLQLVFLVTYYIA